MGISLPSFGLVSALRAFCKYQKPVVGHLGKMRNRLINDILIMSEAKELAQKQTEMLVDLLTFCQP